MERNRRGSWWGLYTLILFVFGMLFLAAKSRVSPVVQQGLLIAIVVVSGILVLNWVGEHEALLLSRGVDAQAEQETLAAQGVDYRRYAPSRTITQAHYRSVVLGQDLGRLAQDSHQRSVDVVRHLGDHDAGLE